MHLLEIQNVRAEQDLAAQKALNSALENQKATAGADICEKLNSMGGLIAQLKESSNSKHEDLLKVVTALAPLDHEPNGTWCYQ